MWRVLGAVLLLVGSVQGCASTEADEQPASATSVVLHVDGMMCEESCAKSVEKILAAQPGVENVAVEFEKKHAVCRIDPQTFDAAAAVAELADQDFAATVEE